MAVRLAKRKAEWLEYRMVVNLEQMSVDLWVHQMVVKKVDWKEHSMADQKVENSVD
jgi:hypothetical protein